MEIITCDDYNESIDNGVRNKWNWQWLEKEVKVDVKKVLPTTSFSNQNLTFFVGEHIRKVGIFFLEEIRDNIKYTYDF